jgi:hypothetical protein
MFQFSRRLQLRHDYNRANILSVDSKASRICRHLHSPRVDVTLSVNDGLSVVALTLQPRTRAHTLHAIACAGAVHVSLQRTRPLQLISFVAASRRRNQPLRASSRAAPRPTRPEERPVASCTPWAPHPPAGRAVRRRLRLPPGVCALQSARTRACASQTARPEHQQLGLQTLKAMAACPPQCRRHGRRQTIRLLQQQNVPLHLLLCRNKVMHVLPNARLPLWVQLLQPCGTAAADAVLP